MLSVEPYFASLGVEKVCLTRARYDLIARLGFFECHNECAANNNSKDESKENALSVNL